MRKLMEIIKEEKDNKKEKKEEKIVFVEYDKYAPFPEDTINYIKKMINKLSKDLTITWNTPVGLVDAAFKELKVPIPSAYQTNRFEQYSDLFGYAIEQLKQSRGFSKEWFRG